MKVIVFICIVLVSFLSSNFIEELEKNKAYVKSYDIKTNSMNNITYQKFILIGKDIDKNHNRFILKFPVYEDVQELLSDTSIEVKSTLFKTLDDINKIEITQYSDLKMYLTEPYCNGWVEQNLDFLEKINNVLYFELTYSEFACGGHPYGDSKIIKISSTTGKILNNNEHRRIYDTNKNYNEYINNLTRVYNQCSDYLDSCVWNPKFPKQIKCNGCSSSIPSFNLILDDKYLEMLKVVREK